MTFDLSVMKIFIHHNKLFLLRDTQHNDHIYIVKSKIGRGSRHVLDFLFTNEIVFFFSKQKNILRFFHPIFHTINCVLRFQMQE